MMPISKRLTIMPALPAVAASLLAAEEKPTVGGQALIEGVMMRGSEKIAWAVRKPDGEAVVESFPFVSVTKRVKVLGFPIIRGVTGLFESMKWGYKALSRAMDISMVEEEGAGKTVDGTADTPVTSSNKRTRPAKSAASAAAANVGDRILLTLSMLAALAISVGLFQLAPMWVANNIFRLEATSLPFNLTAGAVRIALLLLYMWVISLWSETRRLFQYHGAEHKTILAYEDGKALTFGNIDPYSTIHPRCGTSFLVLLAVCGILMSSVIDELYFKYISPEYATLFHRLGVRLAFLPLLAGVSYEALKLSARFKNVPVVNFLILPGLLVQRITTKKPDASQIEIAVKALEAAV